MEPTLQESLNNIFGIASPRSTHSPADIGQSTLVTPQPKSLKNLIAEADRQFSAAQEELKRGNWAGYGEAMKRVERLLGELRNSAE